MSYSTFNKTAEEYATTGYHKAGELLSHTLSRIYDAVPGDATTALYAAALQAAAALEFISGLLAAPVEGDKRSNMGKETMLVAALVTARTIIPVPQDGSVNANFHTHNVLQALEAAKKITGVDVEKFLDPNMLESYRKGAARDKRTTLGYWDYLDGVGPSFEEFGDNLTAYSKARH